MPDKIYSLFICPFLFLFLLISLVSYGDSCVASQVLPAAELAEIDQLFADGWTESARDRLLPLVKKYPKDAKLRFQLARASAWLSDYETADKMSRKCIDLVDDNPEFLLLRGDILGSFARYGSKIKGLSRGKGCRKAYEKAVKLDPSNREARQSLMIFHLMAPGIVGGKESEARKQAQAIEELDPLEGHLVRAQILHYLDNDPEGARQEYLKAIEQYSENPAPYYSFTRYLGKQEDYEEAIRYQRLGIAQDEDPTEAQLDLAAMLSNQKQWHQAQEVYQEILAKDEHNSLAKTHLSKTFFAQDNYVQAQEILDQIRLQDPGFTFADYQEGVFLVKREQDLPRAEADFLRYLDSPINQEWASRAFAQWHLAKAYEKQGRFTKAWEMAEKASQSSPYNSFFKEEAKKMKFLGEDD